MADENIRIVLLGKTGSGKSSLANTLFGEKKMFKVSNSPNSGTKLCEVKIKTVNSRSILLVDTPGLFDTDPNSHELSPELLKCIVECAPGPHAFLLVLKVEKFTKQEQAVVDLILKKFSKEALKYTTVIFTNGDQLDEDQSIKAWVKVNEALRDLVQKCGQRCHVIDNKYWNNSQDEYRNNEKQIEQLLRTIDQMVKENKTYYTNENLQMAHKEIEKKKDEIKQLSPNISETELRIKAKDAAFTKLKKKLGFVILGTLLGGFLGAVGTAIFAPAAAAAVVVVGVGAAVSGVGAAVGGVSGALVSDKIVSAKGLSNVLKKKQ